MVEEEKKNESNVQETQPHDNRPVGLWRAFAMTLMFLVICVVGIYTTDYIGNPRSSLVVRKDNLKSVIVAIVRNGGDLSAVKHVYVNRNKERLFFRPFRRDLENFYPQDITLSSVLNDIKSDYFSATPFMSDTLYYQHLLFIIQENDFHNPFDNLEPNQRYYFENIRAKSGNNYIELQSDIAKISDELHNKNQLVDKYLNKSSLSFIISIIALVISLIASIIQIAQNDKTTKAVDKIANNENQERNT